MELPKPVFKNGMDLYLDRGVLVKPCLEEYGLGQWFSNCSVEP